jgi:hypothetical protein
MKSFLCRSGSLVRFVLSGFDRLRFCGESRLLNNARGVDSYLHVRYTDFPDHAESLTKTLRSRTESCAEQGGVPLQHLNSPEIDKEALASASGRRIVAALLAAHACGVNRLADGA